VDGKIRLYGTNGTNLVHFYDDAATPLFSRLQTALMPMGDPIRTKQALKFAIEATLNTAGTDLVVTVDSEVGSSPSYTLTNTTNWINNFSNTILWKNNVNTEIGFSGAGGVGGYTLYKSDAAQWGKYLGLTLTSTSKEYFINGFEFEHELRVRF
jgi:hypothetical protein